MSVKFALGQIDWIKSTKILIRAILQFPLFTLLVMDYCESEITTVWTIHLCGAQAAIADWLEHVKAVKACICEKQPDWRPSRFVIDDRKAEINAVR